MHCDVSETEKLPDGKPSARDRMIGAQQAAAVTGDLYALVGVLCGDNGADLGDLILTTFRAIQLFRTLARLGDPRPTDLSTDCVHCHFVDKSVCFQCRVTKETCCRACNRTDLPRTLALTWPGCYCFAWLQSEGGYRLRWCTFGRLELRGKVIGVRHGRVRARLGSVVSKARTGIDR